MKNLGNMMKQVQQMQERMQEMQAQLQELEVEGSSGAGMVKVSMTGKGEMKSIKIDPSLVDPADTEVLEDLILAAANDAKAKADEKMQEEMQKLTGRMPLPPGFKLPF
ncbi:MAG: YbaB/EbfC family nucleoid-associated protein [Nisaea sp.]|uniref:YbaB/EbfC family nucleoid-associated protein n=1 Tax=Nisaea sp. TaxID=2024842 RepID=UPI001B24A2DA|nr:YbaB/EbfC family nucleoid-associated protein [Nisaea sp.]MBO6559828.1 YbaB/EbfC family nucleoid-associated protein [Nisaea sp.]